MNNISMQKMMGICIVIIAVIYNVMTTSYFGNNFLPQTPAECITDGITLIIAVIGLAVYSR
jgi:Mn2+/Fe2+ NRAMP family transporter